MERVAFFEFTNGYVLSIVDEIPELIFQEMLKTNLSEDFSDLNWQKNLSESDKINLANLQTKTDSKYSLNLVAEKSDEIVAFSTGWQSSIDPFEFYMAISVVKTEHRKNGLYSFMIDKILEITNAEGFHTLSSRHSVLNNSVLIAKLKKGFHIAAMEIDASLGPLVKLNYHHNLIKKRAAAFRSGSLKDLDILEKFSI